MKTKKIQSSSLASKYHTRSFQCFIFFIFITLSTVTAQVNQNTPSTYNTNRTAINSTATASLSDTSENPDVSNSVGKSVVLEFYPSQGISIQAARRFAYHNGWKLATADDIEKEWQYNNLHLDKCGLIEDGRVSVPLQEKTERFYKGTNIGVATEEVHGFFYYTNE